MSFVKKKFFFIPILIVLGLILYWPALNFDFVSFDDDELILENELVQTCNWDHLKQAFSTHQMGHYLPLTTLSYLFQYAIFKENAGSYHLFSIILHIINGLLVFLFFQKLGFENLKSFLIAGIFIVHPMNLESVAWISARSNLMFSFFYFLSLYTYVGRETHQKQYFTFLFFVLACLSKSAAVTLPIALIWIDIYKKGEVTWTFFNKKIPFFAVSILFGLLAIYFSKEFGTLNTQRTFDWYEKPFLSAFALLFYVFKYIISNNLSALHFFPTWTNTLPLSYYLSLPIVLLLSLILFKWVTNRLVWLGFAWCLLHLVLNLQWITIGKVFAAERYAYISYLGLSLALIEIIPKKYVTFMCVALILYFALMSHSQIQHWKNSNTLYTNIIKQYPEQGYGYYGKGIYFKDQHQNDSAVSYFSMAIEHEPQFPNAYLNRANIYTIQGKITQAIEDYNTVITQNKTYKEAYFNLGYLYYKIENYEASLKNLKKSSELGVKSNYVYLLMADDALNLGLKPLSCEYYTQYLGLGGEKISQINYCN